MPQLLSLKPDLLRWARERASLEPEKLAMKAKVRPEEVAAWENTGRITLSNLEKVARHTHTPVGYLFLPTPPEETLPTGDFRTLAGPAQARPSPDLLDVLYACQFRQAWFREHLIAEGEAPLPFVGSARRADDPASVARAMREALTMDEGWPPPGDAAATVGDLTKRAEALGVMVMRSGVVGNNTRRKLRVAEFRGFALADEYAPLVFVNGADAVTAQLFTLAHELAHVWRGESGVSDVRLRATTNAEERFCNRVAADVLLPPAELAAEWDAVAPGPAVARAARRHRVSAFVVLIQARDTGLLPRDEFDRRWDAEEAAAEARPAAKKKGGGGGNFYATQATRLGRRFARAVIGGALEGRLSYTDAHDLLGIPKAETFDKLARTLGVIR